MHWLILCVPRCVELDGRIVFVVRLPVSSSERKMKVWHMMMCQTQFVSDSLLNGFVTD